MEGFQSLQKRSRKSRLQAHCPGSTISFFAAIAKLDELGSRAYYVAENHCPKGVDKNEEVPVEVEEVTIQD
jgi:hypothetical protein